MSFESSIEWTMRTWNCLIGCTKKSKGCMNCYAIRVAWRLMHNPNPKIAARYAGTVERDSGGQLNWTGRINFDDEVLMYPLRWREPSRIFVNSLSDIFHKNVENVWRDRMFAVMALCPQHTFQILTKEPQAAFEYLSDPETPDRIGQASINDHDVIFSGAPDCSEDFRYLEWPLPNVWLGTSIEDQETADKRLPLLINAPAAVRWVSAEPLLGAVDLSIYLVSGYTKPPYDDILNWVVAGGESGPDSRPSHPDWFRALRDQCNAAGVPFFFKQWGDWAPAYVLDDAPDTKLPRKIAHEHMGLVGICKPVESNIIVNRILKKNAGRTLDGRTWDEMPEEAG